MGSGDEGTSYSIVRVATLRGDRDIPFDAFVKVAGKHIPFCRRGEKLEGERLERLRRKNLKSMYVRDSEMPAYRRYLEENVRLALDPANALAKRAEIMQGLALARAEDVMDAPLDPSRYADALATCGHLRTFVLGQTGAGGALLRPANPDSPITQHALNVAVLSLLVARRTGEPSGGRRVNLLLGALLHDIEKYLDPETGAPTPERGRAHPMDGARRFGKAAHADPLVLGIIAGHGERADGGGFPRGLGHRDLDPLVLVVSAVNAYDRQVSFHGREPKDALKTFLVEEMGRYPLPLLQALQLTLKAEGVL